MTKSEYVQWMLEQQRNNAGVLEDALKLDAQIASVGVKPDTSSDASAGLQGMRDWLPPEEDRKVFTGIDRTANSRYVFTEPDSHGSPVRALAWAFLIVTVLAVGCVALVGL